LYGLKQFPYEWNHKINAYFLSQKFERSFVDHNIYFKKTQKKLYVIIALHVDDLILTCKWCELESIVGYPI